MGKYSLEDISLYFLSSKKGSKGLIQVSRLKVMKILFIKGKPFLMSLNRKKGKEIMLKIKETSENNL